MQIIYVKLILLTSTMYFCVCSVNKNLHTNNIFNKCSNDFTILVLRKKGVNIIIDYDDFSNLNDQLKYELVQSKVPLQSRQIQRLMFTPIK